MNQTEKLSKVVAEVDKSKQTLPALNQTLLPPSAGLYDVCATPGREMRTSASAT